MTEIPRCPSCGCTSDILYIEYMPDMKDHYDGTSEYRCRSVTGKNRVCDTRWGRWTKRILLSGETEPPHGGKIFDASVKPKTMTALVAMSGAELKEDYDRLEKELEAEKVWTNRMLEASGILLSDEFISPSRFNALCADLEKTVAEVKKARKA